MPYSPMESSVKVYPRVCGGTWARDPAYIDAHGLSPRVRGNRDLGRKVGAFLRSIPACAGEPYAGWMVGRR